MKKQALLLSLLLAAAIPAHASADWFGDLRRVSFSFVDNGKNAVEVTLKYKISNYFDPEPRPEKIVTSIQVVYLGKTIVIPAEELEGISKIQLDSIAFRNGTYQGGSPYCYIECLFGPPMKESEDGYQRVWFLMQDEYKSRRTIANLPGFFKTTAVKEKGKPEKKSEQAVDGNPH
jgi:hypothetical protein